MLFGRPAIAGITLLLAGAGVAATPQRRNDPIPLVQGTKVGATAFELEVGTPFVPPPVYVFPNGL